MYVLRQNYGGFPINDNDHFDTEMISNIIFDMKRGKAADMSNCRAFAVVTLCYYLNSFC